MHGTFGAGCGGPAPGLEDGGLRATFTRSDPLGGSAASFELGVPANVTLDAVRIARLTSGFGGSPQPGDPLVYTAATSLGPLESTSLADATDVPLAGLLTAAPAVGEFVTFGVACALDGQTRCAPDTTAPVGVEVQSIALVVTDATPPQAAVGGVQSPASGQLNLLVRASDIGLGLASAAASLDGGPAVTVPLGGPTCADLSPGDATVDLPLGAACPATATDVPLAVPLPAASVPDGVHQLTVTVTDAAGNTATVVNQPISVLNHPPVSSPTANLEVGTGGGGAAAANGNGSGSGSGSAGGAATAAASVCRSPRLTAVLAERPLRYSRRHHPVLLYRHRYRFTGRLTCLVAGRRHNAPAETIIDVLNRVGHRYLLKSGTTVRTGGAFTILLAYPSDRTIEFAFRPGGHTAAAVTIVLDVTRTTGHRA